MAFCKKTHVKTPDKDMILNEHPRHPIENIPCLFCEKPIPGDALKCPHCKIVRYCNTKCRLSHWDKHKGPCEKFKLSKHKFSGNSDIATVLPSTKNSRGSESAEKEWSIEKVNSSSKRTKDNPEEPKQCSSSDQSLPNSSKTSVQCSWCKKDNPSAKKCTKCKSVSYCDKECQRQHWSQHKYTCGQNDSSDSCVGSESVDDVNEETQKIGQEVMLSEGHEEKIIQCYFCKKTNPKAKKCSKCMVALYCNQQCQKKDFREHKHSCKNLPKFFETLSKADQLLANLHNREVTELVHPPRIYASLFVLVNPNSKAMLLEIVAPFHHFCRLGVYVQDVKGDVSHMLFHHKKEEEQSLLPASLKEVLRPGNFIRWFYPRWRHFTDGQLGFRVDSLYEMEFIYKTWDPLDWDMF